MRKRYWLFSWHDYYAIGGSGDVSFKFDDFEDFKSQTILDGFYGDQLELLDLDTGKFWKSYKGRYDRESYLDFVKNCLES